MSFIERADPEIVPVLDVIPHLDLSGDIPAAREKAARERQALLAAVPEVPGVTTRDVTAEGLGDDPEVMVRVYEPESGDHSGAALLYVHGGGMVLMRVDDTDFHCKSIVDRIGCVVVSVEYRLAPESPYPAAVHDCYAALAWLHRNADDLEVASDRIAIGGLSAGGGLAAGTALMARDRGEHPLCFQWLVYPMIDDRNVTPSSREITEPSVWNRASNLRAWDAYLGPGLAPGSDDVPLYAAPARATTAQLAGLPPAYIDVGELDVFRDEDVGYASRLLQAGVPTELHVTPGAFHASEMYNPGASSSRRITRARMEALSRFLA